MYIRSIGEMAEKFESWGNLDRLKNELLHEKHLKFIKDQFYNNYTAEDKPETPDRYMSFITQHFA